MKRAPSEDLFRLIKSLSKGEKRNFKLLAGLLASEKDKRYIELFDVIDRQEAYNEGKVAKVMKDLYGGQLAVGKHYLYRLILRSLVYFRNTPGADIHNLMDQVKVLMEKELYQQAGKLLRKGLQEAAELEDFLSVHSLLTTQVEITLRTMADKALNSRLEELEAAKVEVLDKLHNLDDFKSLSYRAFQLQQTRIIASGAIDQAALSALKDHPLLANPAQAKSKRAMLEFLGLKRKLSSLSADIEGAARYSGQLLSLYESVPVLKEELVRDYFSELANLCTYLLRLGRSREAFAKMQEFRSYRDQYPKARLDFFQLYYVLQVAAAIHYGEPARALAIVPEIEAEWRANEGKIPKAHEILLKYLLAYAYFMEGRLSEALKWVNRLLSGPRQAVRLDIQGNARLLNLAIHLDLGNHQLVESESLSTRRFLDKHDHLNDFERQALRCIKALSAAAKLPNEQAVRELWAGRMREYEERNPGQGGTEMLDMVGWLTAHLQGKTIAEYRREQVGEGAVPQFAF